MTTETARTPNLAETIQALIKANLLELHTHLPAKIVSYDYTTNLAVVQPLLKRKYKSEDSSVELPTISNVPVAFPRIGSAHLRLPVNPEDEGSLKFMERSIDKWLTEGGCVDPEDPRRFSLSDAVFELGLTSQINPMISSGANDSLELQYNASFIEILSSGKFKVSNGADELFLILTNLMEVLKTATDVAGIPFNAGTIAALEAIRIRLDLMKG